MRRRVLKGVKGVYVLTESLPLVAKELGITERSLKTEVELKLRLAGIGVYSREEWLKNPLEISTLYINLNITSGTIRGMRHYPFHISINLRDVVYIQRSLSRTLLTTWSEGILGAYSTKEVELGRINKALKTITDIFLNYYLAVNPKK